MGSRLHFQDFPLPGVEVRTSTIGDCLRLGPNLRNEDKEEILAALGCEPTEGLTHTFFNSQACLTIVQDGEPTTMFGSGRMPDQKGVGMIWMLSSPELLKIKKPFLRESKRFIALLTAPYDVVMNYVDCRNLLHRRWLEWCGFVFIAKHDSFGVGKLPFYEFVRI